ncbi:MAG: ABC transporter substrate-binding protein [Thermodesulforhabdaceae bacterium]
MLKKFFLPVLFSFWLISGISLAEVEGSLSVEDFRGKKITLPKPPQRIVCLIESALSGLYMLKKQDLVVGVSRNVYENPTFLYYAHLDDRIKKRAIPAPGNWDFVNIESVVALKPDLVIIWAQQLESISLLEEKGIPVFGVFLQSEEDIYREIESLGKLTGSEERARELLAFVKEERRKMVEEVSRLPERPRVYFMWAQGKTETSCGGSTVNDLIELAGGVNICAGIKQEHVVLNLETIISANPDVIVMWSNSRLNPEDLLSDPQWQNIKAVKTRRVYELPEIFNVDLWTLKFIYAAKLMFSWLHPEAFQQSGKTLEEERNRIFRFLYDLRENDKLP